MAFTQTQLDALIRLGQQSGQILRGLFASSADSWIKNKGDESPLTKADILVHNLLVETLVKIEDLPILSEEGTIAPYEERKTWTRYWVIDPLDGTKEFLKGIAEFTVNIALIEKGIPTFGLMVDPVGERLYWSQAKQGAFCIDKGGLSRRLLGPEQPGSQSLRVLKSASDPLQESQQFLSQQNPPPTLRSLGSSLKFAMLAEGQADLYLRDIPLNEWDIAAGDALWRYATESGATRASPFSYNQRSLKILRFAVGLGETSFELRPT